MEDMAQAIRSCRLCAERFAQTATAHAPRPVLWDGARARLLIAGQAPGMRVHLSGQPFTDPSGDRLRDWLGIRPEVFMTAAGLRSCPWPFVFRGWMCGGRSAAAAPLCPYLARAASGAAPQAAAGLGHRGARDPLAFAGPPPRDRGGGRLAPPVAAGDIPLPHPSWRNTGWLKRNPWFATDLLPDLRAAVRAALTPDVLTPDPESPQ
ncbi:uracil-DNA glycosylase family protein [Gemmobacter lanyuensis]